MHHSSPAATRNAFGQLPPNGSGWHEMTSPRAKTLLASINRLEGTTAILESDDGREFSVPVKTFEQRPKEGMMYRAPLNADGSPNWPMATIDRDAESKRRKELDAKLGSARNH